MAAVDAQGRAAQACYEFISKVGFDPPSGGNGAGPSKVRQITFAFERKAGQSAASGAPGTDVVPANNGNIPLPPGSVTTITVPLLTVMPLPFIRIESVTLNFKAAISAVNEQATSQASSTAANADGKLALGFGPWKVDVGGSISSKKDSTATSTSKYSVEHTMDISVHAVQEDMPAGLAKLLSLLTDSIAVARA